MSRFYVRCRNSKCQARQTLPMHPDKYARCRRCWSCGMRKGWRVDRWMMRRDTRAMGCSCMGYNWGGIMHRRGSLHCWFYREHENAA